MGKMKAVLKLTRIEHSIILLVAVIAAELISAHHLPGLAVFVLSMITPAFVSMGSFAINDYYDIGADRANKRMDRPLVNGSLTKRQAMWIVVSCFVIGVLASLFINAYAFVIALIFAALAILYSYRLKDMPVLGNIYIAFSMVIPFVYGDFVVTNSFHISIVLISITIFLAGVAREIHGMIRDYKGDEKARGSRNLLFHVGKARASQLAAILYAEAVLVSIYMFFFYAPFAFNLVYIVPIAITDVTLLYISYGFLVQKKSREFYGFSRNASLAVMALSVLAFLAAALLYVRI
ncbi:MAG: UbiA family prenyltransferase [Candidatus Micrarchaeaceae archaeon]